jgi:ankyrin repeat protein
MSSNIHDIIRAGDYKFARFLVKKLYKDTNFGFNDLHFNVLQDYKDGESLPDFKSVSIAKKAGMNQNITPLHFACINPNPKVLEQLLNVNPDVNITDMQMRKPVHFASACESVEPLKLLIAKGANIIDVDMRKVSPLHIAA